MRGNGGGAVRPRSHPKAKALGRTKPLLLSVPSGRAAHRSGERRSPDTRKVGGDPSTKCRWNTGTEMTVPPVFHLQTRPRDRVQVTWPGPPPRR